MEYSFLNLKRLIKMELFMIFYKNKIIFNITLLFLLLFPANGYSAVPNTFTEGELISSIKFNENMAYIQSYADEQGATISFSTSFDGDITSSELNAESQKIMNLNNEIVIPLLTTKTIITHTKINDFFNNLESGINQLSKNYLYVFYYHFGSQSLHKEKV